MATLSDMARLIRSKNAGPFEITFDIMFEDLATYERVKRVGIIDPELFARMYRLPLEDIRVYAYDPGLAIKVTIPRPIPSGDLGDTDVFGGQLYGPLCEVEIPGDPGASPATI